MNEKSLLHVTLFFLFTIIKDTVISFHFYFINTMKCDKYFLSTFISNIIIRFDIIWYSALKASETWLAQTKTLLF